MTQPTPDVVAIKNVPRDYRGNDTHYDIDVISVDPSIVAIQDDDEGRFQEVSMALWIKDKASRQRLTTISFTQQDRQLASRITKMLNVLFGHNRAQTMRANYQESPPRIIISAE